MLKTNAYKENKPIPASQVVAVGVTHLLHGKGSKKVGFNTWFISNRPESYTRCYNDENIEETGKPAWLSWININDVISYQK